METAAGHVSSTAYVAGPRNAPRMQIVVPAAGRVQQGLPNGHLGLTLINHRGANAEGCGRWWFGELCSAEKGHCHQPSAPANAGRDRVRRRRHCSKVVPGRAGKDRPSRGAGRGRGLATRAGGGRRPRPAEAKEVGGASMFHATSSIDRPDSCRRVISILGFPCSAGWWADADVADSRQYRKLAPPQNSRFTARYPRRPTAEVICQTTVARGPLETADQNGVGQPAVLQLRSASSSGKPDDQTWLFKPGSDPEHSIRFKRGRKTAVSPGLRRCCRRWWTPSRAFTVDKKVLQPD